jgi:hypothetical protein
LNRLLLLPGVDNIGGFGKTGFGSRKKMIYEIFLMVINKITYC